MRYAIVSDIHANLQAWNAVLLDIRSSGVDKILCLGDLVGYGPQPAETLQSLYEHVDHFILGNHDAAACGKLDASYFNDGARELIEWTREQLNPEAIAFLQKLPLTLHAGSFRCAHGDFSAPGAFRYVVDPEDAEPSWQAVDEQLLFVGHSHDPAIFVRGESGAPHRVSAQDFALEEGKRYLVNVGSVGQPRDGDARACYCIYDTSSGDVLWRRIPFDIDGYRAAMEAAGLSTETSYFLSADPRLAATPVREQLNFSPPQQAGDVTKAVAVEEVEVLHRRVSRWRRLALLALVTALVGFSLVGVGVWYRLSRAEVLQGVARTFTWPLPLPLDTELVSPWRGDLRSGGAKGWTIYLGNQRRQQVSLWDSEIPLLSLASTTLGDPVRLVLPPMEVEAGMKFKFAADIQTADDFQGTIKINLALQRREGVRHVMDHSYASSTANMYRESKSRWPRAQKTTPELPKGAELLIATIEGHFVGKVAIRNVSLQRTR
jgi:diadenosine tetraphosphatase ApaH/serine/threonine PP2A family protein phosphatase